MSFVVVTPPNAEPISATEARARLNIGATTTDAVIDALIKTARQKLERRYGIAMVEQGLEYTIDQFPGSIHRSLERGFGGATCHSLSSPFAADIVIPMTPLKSDAVTAVSYLDPSGVTQTLPGDSYTLAVGDLQSRLTLGVGAAWPATQFVSGAVSLRMTAGFGAPPDVPEALKMAIILQVGHLQSLTAQNLFLSQVSVEGVGERRYVVGTGSSDVIDRAVASIMQNYERPSL